jgi:hypothetical protein
VQCAKCKRTMQPEDMIECLVCDAVYCAECWRVDCKCQGRDIRCGYKCTPWHAEPSSTVITSEEG